MLKLLALALIIHTDQPSEKRSYYVESPNVVFLYDGNAGESVVVSGNFNNWCSDCSKWKMTRHPVLKKWILSVPINEIKKKGQNFYEFTFRIDGKLAEADKSHYNTIYCPGYGYRYVIREI